MTQATAGTIVQFHYTGTLEDGTVFDSSQGREPLEFEMGSGMIIPGLDRAIEGMSAGEEKTVTIPCAEAYGDYRPEGRQDVPREQFPDNIPLEAGTQLQMQTQDGRAIPVVIAEVGPELVTLDANHPLAGKDLTFAVEVVSVSTQD
ncbi:MAG: peptidylprolyl isomerase [Rhodobacteraceae bacterium]|nr:MAG: peptidylprolyl isomerase [Paracoccaceae bacterium]